MEKEPMPTLARLGTVVNPAAKAYNTCFHNHHKYNSLQHLTRASADLSTISQEHRRSDGLSRMQKSQPQVFGSFAGTKDEGVPKEAQSMVEKYA